MVASDDARFSITEVRLGITAAAILPELGTTSPKRITALVGLAPYNDDSGPRKGQRQQ